MLVVNSQFEFAVYYKATSVSLQLTSVSLQVIKAILQITSVNLQVMMAICSLQEWVYNLQV